MTNITTIAETPQKVIMKTNILSIIDKLTKTKKPHVEIMEMTHEMATDILTRNKNRHISQNQVSDLVWKYDNDQFIFNGDTLRFDWDGNLRDGQHRLTAQEITKKTVTYIVVTGLDPKSMATMDIGKKRTAGDVLSMMNIINPNQTAAAIRFIINFKETNTVSGKIGSHRIGNLEIEKWITNQTQHKKLQAMAELTHNVLMKKKWFSASQWIGLAYIINDRNAQKATTFLNALIEGQNISKTGKTSSIYFLREKMDDLSSKSLEAKNLKSNQLLTRKVQYFVRAWNVYVSEKRITELELDRDYMKESKIEAPIK